MLELESSKGSIAVFHSAGMGQANGTLICVHGGPGGDHRGNSGIFDELASVCGPMGYDVVQFDMFGNGQSAGRAEDMTLLSQVADYNAVLGFARKELPSPIHVVGESMGATIAALDWHDDVASYVLLWPAFDLVDTDLRPYFSDPWYSRLQEEGSICDGDLIVGRQFIDEIQSQDFAPCFDLPSTPCLLIHGRQDSAVPLRQSFTAVARCTREAVLFVHPTGDHGLQSTAERQFVTEAYSWWFARDFS